VTTKTIYRWEQDRAGGDHGTLTLWPGKPREMSLQVQDFATAYKLGQSIEAAHQQAFAAGRESFRADIARLVTDT
jgi:hypothetical protein